MLARRLGRVGSLITSVGPLASFSDAPAAVKPPRPEPWRTEDPNGPKIVKLHSSKVFLNAGEKVWWCSCGLSKDQPWCDGSHEGTRFEPIEFTASEARMYGMCLCKYSAKGAICDGVHKEFIGYVKPSPKQ